MTTKKAPKGIEFDPDKIILDDAEAEHMFSKARTRLLLKHPFFGQLTMWLHPQQAKIPTLCTEGTRIMYNPMYIKTLSDKALATAIAHETLHVAFRHVSKRRRREPFEIWNVAADCFINELLATNDDMEVNEFWVMCNKVPWKKGLKLDSSTVLQHTAEQIFDRIDYTTITISVGGCGLEDSKEGGKGDGSGEDGDSNNDGNGTGNVRSTIEDQKWAGRIKAAYDEAAKRGRGPAGMQETIDKLLKPKKDWRDLLAQWMSVDRTDYGWNPPDRRFTDDAFVLPDLVEEEKIQDIVCAIDTSGSISSKMLQHFASEVFAIRRMGTRIWLIYCDDGIDPKKGVFLLDDLDPHNLPTPIGRGGTSFVPVFDWVKKHPDMNCKSLVYLTDSMGDHPKEQPPYPVLWIVPEQYMSQAPNNLHWGRIVDYPLKDY